MYDLHNHLLPGLDDGAPDMEAAIIMAKMAWDDGVTHMVCTPHIHPGRYDTTARAITKALDAFKRALAARDIGLRVAAAAEVRIGTELMEGIEQKTLPFLGEWEGKKVLLLELPHSSIPLGSDKLTQWLIGKEIVPLIAHPERNKAIMAKPSRLRPFVAQGCLLQVTAGSLTGHFGSQAQTLAESLLREGKVAILATDAHNPKHRPPLLSPGLKAAAAIMGDKEATRLVETNPKTMTKAVFG